MSATQMGFWLVGPVGIAVATQTQRAFLWWWGGVRVSCDSVSELSRNTPWRTVPGGPRRPSGGRHRVTGTGLFCWSDCVASEC